MSASSFPFDGDTAVGEGSFAGGEAVLSTGEGFERSTGEDSLEAGKTASLILLKVDVAGAGEGADWLLVGVGSVGV